MGEKTILNVPKCIIKLIKTVHWDTETGHEHLFSCQQSVWYFSRIFSIFSLTVNYANLLYTLL